jgi:cell division septum initiation protein DivIVA
MNRDLIQQRIQQCRTAKRDLLQRAKELYNQLQKYHQIREEYIKYRKQYESLDKEEKLLFYSLPENKPTPKKQNRSKNIEKTAEEKAMAVLNNLPPEARKAVITNLKKGEK